MVREIAMDAHPAVAHGVEAGERIPHRRQRLAVDQEVARAAQREGGVAPVDACALRRQPAQFAELRGSRAPSRERLCARFADPIRRAHDRIGAAANVPAEAAQAFHATRTSTATTPCSFTMSGLISASATPLSVEKAATARASAFTSPRGRLR